MDTYIQLADFFFVVYLEDKPDARPVLAADDPTHFSNETNPKLLRFRKALVHHGNRPLASDVVHNRNRPHPPLRPLTIKRQHSKHAVL